METEVVTYKKIDKFKGQYICKDIISRWSKVYTNQVFFIQNEGNIWSYQIEFSKPQNQKPIPEGTMKVQFTIIDTADEPETEVEKTYRIKTVNSPKYDHQFKYEVEFNFENESLIHKYERSTMRTSMFESWINNVIEKKLRTKSELYMGSEFEYSRFVDNSGKIVDPFVPKFDIMKVKDTMKQRDISQEINVDSPRFITTLRRAIEEMFETADTDNDGLLNYQEFEDSWKVLQYGLTDLDVRIMIALADEDENEMIPINQKGLEDCRTNQPDIPWTDFVSIAVDVVRTIFRRNLTGRTPNVPSDALKIIYKAEIDKCEQLLTHDMKHQDTGFLTKSKLTGLITLQNFKTICRQTNMLTPKERNLLIRTQKEEIINYRNFKDMLYQVRFEIATAKLMDVRMDELADIVLAEFKIEDPDGDNNIEIALAKDCLMRCKWLALTPFMVQTILGIADPDSNGEMVFKEYCPICVDYIEENYEFDDLVVKQQILLDGKIESTTHEACQSFDAIEMFRTFKKFDRNQNGTLDFGEYMQCLDDCGLPMRPAEKITMTLAADLNGDGEIDFQEFIKHFCDALNAMSFERKLSEAFQLVMEEEEEAAKLEAGDSKDKKSEEKGQENEVTLAATVTITK